MSLTSVNDHVHNIVDRQTVCGVKTCGIKTINPEILQAIVKSRASRPFTSTRQEVYDDLLRKCHTAEPLRILTSKRACVRKKTMLFKYEIGDIKVCLNCYAASFCLSKQTVFRYVQQIRKGETQFIDKRKLFYGNHSHSPQSLAVAKEKADEYFEYAKQHLAMPVPHSTLNREGRPMAVLAASYSQECLHQNYINWCKEKNYRTICFNLFVDRWHTKHQNLTPQTKKTCYCSTCFKHYNKVKGHAATADDTETFEEHRKLADLLRKDYHDKMEESEKNPDSLKTYYTDKAEAIQAPVGLVQPAENYFDSLLKLSLTGVGRGHANEVILHCYNEGETIDINGAGDGDANAVISCLYSAMKDEHADEMLIQADNCAAQNKNRFMLKYAMFLIEKEFCAKVLIRFMGVGHTKSHLDSAFGIAKCGIKRHEIYDADDVIAVINNTMNTGKSKTTYRGVGAPTWYNWKSYLEKRYGNWLAKGISAFQQFEVKKFDNQLIVSGRLCDSEPYKVMKKLRISSVKEASLDVISPAGVDSARLAKLERLSHRYANTKFPEVVQNIRKSSDCDDDAE